MTGEGGSVRRLLVTWQAAGEAAAPAQPCYVAARMDMGAFSSMILGRCRSRRAPRDRCQRPRR